MVKRKVIALTHRTDSNLQLASLSSTLGLGLGLGLGLKLKLWSGFGSELESELGLGFEEDFTTLIQTCSLLAWLSLRINRSCSHKSCDNPMVRAWNLCPTAKKKWEEEKEKNIVNLELPLKGEVKHELKHFSLFTPIFWNNRFKLSIWVARQFHD